MGFSDAVILIYVRCNVAIFVALAIPGYCLSKGKIIKPENCGALSNLLTYVGVPFLIFSGTLQTKIDREFVKSALVSAVIFSFVLMIIYFSLLFIGTAFKVTVKNGNLVIYPNFSYGWFSMKFIPYRFSLTNILVNLALLLPSGFIVFMFVKKHKFLNTILFAFFVSCFIELYQFALPISRATELTDILFNTLSGLISASYCLILKKCGLFKNSNIPTKNNKNHV